MLNLIKAVEDNAKAEELTGEESDGLLKVKGSLDGGDYMLTVDENGLLNAFEMPNNKLTMRFTDMKTADITAEQTATDVTAETTSVISTVTTA